MNCQKIIELLLDGAYLEVASYRFYHPSFRKGWRKMSSSNISFCAAERVLREMGKPVNYENGIYSVKKS